MMRLLPILLVGAVLAAAPALARQGDARLEPLFDLLLQSDDPHRVIIAEKEIWGIWHESGSATIDLLLNAGIQAMNRGEQSDAIERFSAVIDLAPDFAEGWNKRATAHYLAGNFDASVDDIAKTLELEPRHFGALSGLGLIYDALDEPEGALKAYRRALAVNPHLKHPRQRLQALKKELKDRNI